MEIKPTKKNQIIFNCVDRQQINLPALVLVCLCVCDSDYVGISRLHFRFSKAIFAYRSSFPFIKIILIINKYKSKNENIVDWTLSICGDLAINRVSFSKFFSIRNMKLCYLARTIFHDAKVFTKNHVIFVTFFEYWKYWCRWIDVSFNLHRLIKKRKKKIERN